MPESVIMEFLSPPASPDQCIFAQTTRTISADFSTRVEPCQFGGDPDCSRCGCYASMGLAAVGHQSLVGSITAGDIFWTSNTLGQRWLRGEEKFRRLLLPKQSGLGKKNSHSLSKDKDLLKVIGNSQQ
jgi:hypothetical protein